MPNQSSLPECNDSQNQASPVLKEHATFGQSGPIICNMRDLTMKETVIISMYSFLRSLDFTRHTLTSPFCSLSRSKR